MDKTQQSIKRYFDGELDSDELAAFKKRLADDPAFAEAFQREKDQLFGKEQTDAKKPSIFDPFVIPELDNKTGRMTRRNWLLAAAVLGIGLIAQWFSVRRQPTPQQLYAIFAVHQFTGMSNGEKLLAQSEVLLKEKKYAEALPLLGQYLAGSPHDLSVQKARGIALLETGEYAKAIALFEAIKNGNTMMENEMQWYLALAHLKQGRVGESKGILEGVPENAANYGKAEKLLKYLKRQKE